MLLQVCVCYFLICQFESMPQHNVMTKVRYSLKTSSICLRKCRLPHCGLNVVTKIENFVCFFLSLRISLLASTFSVAYRLLSGFRYNLVFYNE
jgi:hypothetical protein